MMYDYCFTLKQKIVLRKTFSLLYHYLCMIHYYKYFMCLYSPIEIHSLLFNKSLMIDYVKNLGSRNFDYSINRGQVMLLRNTNNIILTWVRYFNVFSCWFSSDIRFVTFLTCIVFGFASIQKSNRVISFPLNLNQYLVLVKQ